jgi:glycerol-3-phosphate O-acyltransferase / dihydroxyacetone phosphate acyltransferase
MLYYLLKELLRPALRIFYTPSTVKGREHLAETGPLVVVANHPNTLMDPLLVGMLWRRQLRFLTSSRFFVGFGDWVLRSSGAIPLYRQEDHGPSASADSAAARLTGVQRSARNEDSFRATFDLLQAGGALLIFPEGSSILTRRLRPFKSGAARIALGAEARHDWQLGVQIVPVGLNYAAADRFGSRLTRHVGPPISVVAYRKAYEANPSAAIRALTEELRRALSAQLIVPTTTADEDLLRALAPLLPDLRAAALPHQPNAADADFILPQSVLQALTWLATHEPQRGQALRQRLTRYHHTRHRLRLTMTAETPLQALTATTVLTALLGSPLWAWGLLNNFVAYGLPTTLAPRLTRDAEFRASIIMGLGMVSVPLGYGLQTGLVWRFTHAAGLTIAYLLSLPLTGAFALAYQRRLARWGSQYRVWRMARTRPQLLEAVRTQHAALVVDLQQLLKAWTATTDAS